MTDTKPKEDEGGMETFDMYSHLSKPTVVLALIFIVIAVLVMLYGWLTSGHLV